MGERGMAMKAAPAASFFEMAQTKFLFEFLDNHVR